MFIDLKYAGFSTKFNAIKENLTNYIRNNMWNLEYRYIKYLTRYENF